MTYPAVHSRAILVCGVGYILMNRVGYVIVVTYPAVHSRADIDISSPIKIHGKKGSNGTYHIMQRVGE